MLAQSHRHVEVVKLLQKEMKRKSHWMPPLSELWALLFGGAGDSKGPLLFFLMSVLLWGYPMYIIRVSIILGLLGLDSTVESLHQSVDMQRNPKRRLTRPS